MKWEEENVTSLKISVQLVIIVMGWAVQGLLKNVPLAPSQMKHSKLPAVAHVVLGTSVQRDPSMNVHACRGDIPLMEKYAYPVKVESTL